MAHLMGYRVADSDDEDGTIRIAYSGLRPGEKLYEELLIGETETDTETESTTTAEEGEQKGGRQTQGKTNSYRPGLGDAGIFRHARNNCCSKG